MSSIIKCNYLLPKKIANYKKNDGLDFKSFYDEYCQNNCYRYYDQLLPYETGCQNHCGLLGQCQGFVPSSETYYPFELCQNNATNELKINYTIEIDNFSWLNDTKEIIIDKLKFCQNCFEKYNQNNQENSKYGHFVGYSPEEMIFQIYPTIHFSIASDPTLSRFSNKLHFSPRTAKYFRQDQMIEPEFSYIDINNNIYILYKKDISPTLRKNQNKLKKCYQCSYHYLDKIDWCPNHGFVKDLNGGYCFLRMICQEKNIWLPEELWLMIKQIFECCIKYNEIHSSLIFQYGIFNILRMSDGSGGLAYLT